MCTAYEIGNTNFDVDWLVADAFEAAMFEEGNYQIIRPTLMAPVIMASGKAQLMKWGFRHVPWGKTRPTWVGNSREDKLNTALWSKSFKERRCLIPAATFYEWTTDSEGKAVPLRFNRSDGRAMWIAGIWGEREDWGEWYSMITTEPTAAIAPVHDRMPAVLADEQLRPYLAGTLNEFGPSTVSLDWREAENFIKKENAEKAAKKQVAPKAPMAPRNKRGDSPDQGKLF